MFHCLNWNLPKKSFSSSNFKRATFFIYICIYSKVKASDEWPLFIFKQNRLCLYTYITILECLKKHKSIFGPLLRCPFQILAIFILLFCVYIILFAMLCPHHIICCIDGTPWDYSWAHAAQLSTMQILDDCSLSNN